MKTNLTSTLAILATVFAVYSGCAPQAQNTDVVDANRTASKSSIVGGVNASADFQKQNGIVGLIIFSERSVLARVGGKLVTKTVPQTSLCTGSLIHQKVILTAAHCVFSFTSDTKVIAAAAYFKPDISSVTQADLIYAVSLAINPDFLTGASETVGLDQITWNDMALIKLEADAPADFQLVKRPAKTDSLKIDATTKVVLSGFGISSAIVAKEELNPVTGQLEVVKVPEETSTSGVLRIVEGIPVVGLSTDSKEIELNQTNSKGACHGDSGGPAFLKLADGSLVQIGITSRGTEKLGNCTENAIYTNVASYFEWIEATMGDLLKATPAVVAEQKPASTEAVIQ